MIMENLQFNVLVISGNNIKAKSKKKGFTLIEVIAVVAILAILGAILVPNVLGYRKKAEKANIQTSAKTVMSAIEAYNSDKTLSDDQIGDTSASFAGKITYAEGIDKLISEEVLDSAKIPDCLNKDNTDMSVENLGKVSEGNFSITNLDGKASTISVDSSN